MRYDLLKLLRTLVFVLAVAGCTREQLPVGRWDITVYKGKQTYPSWLEISRTDKGLQGRFVGRTGSVRPVTTLRYQSDQLHFSLPVQWEKHPGDMEFNATFDGSTLQGTTYDENGAAIKFDAVRAPDLSCREQFRTGPELDLLDLEWAPRFPDSTNGWVLENGVLENIPPSIDIYTKEKFSDFVLSAEVWLPDSSNSGIYLRGRYEVQLTNRKPEKTGDKGKMGAVYGFVAPDTLFPTPANQWYRFEISLTGRCVSVRMNDMLIIDDQEIPGITGGALDSREGEPGPVMLQGDHGRVRFRNLKLRPILD